MGRINYLLESIKSKLLDLGSDKNNKVQRDNYHQTQFSEDKFKIKDVINSSNEKNTKSHLHNNLSSEEIKHLTAIFESGDLTALNKSDAIKMNIEREVEEFYNLHYKVEEFPIAQDSETGEYYDCIDDSHDEDLNKLASLKDEIRSNIGQTLKQNGVLLEEYKTIPTSNTIHERELASSECKTLVGDVISETGKEPQIDNLRIIDKSTGKTERMHAGNIDICKQPQESIKKLLSGNKVEMTNRAGLTNLVGLNKTVTGWGISVAKQVFNTADSSAGI